MLTVYKP